MTSRALAAVVALLAVGCASGSSEPPRDTAPAPSPAGRGSAQPTASANGERTVLVPGGSYRIVSPARLMAMLAAEDFLLVNVHVPYEGEIPGTDRFIPYDQVEGWIGALGLPRNAKVVVYCWSGRMSAIAAATLVRLGYSNIWDLEGGMIAWEASGYRLLQRPPS